jgi:nuclear transport factor 2 (NTF2) superfamily protein
MAVRKCFSKMSTTEDPRPPFPPFDANLPRRKFAWPRTHGTPAIRNEFHSPIRPTALGATVAEFLSGREAIVQFLTRKWNKELDYRLIKELWAFHGSRIAVRFAYEWHDDAGNWFRSYGNENWEFDEHGFMRKRIASINDLPLRESDRKYHWPLGRRPDEHPSLSDLGL